MKKVTVFSKDGCPQCRMTKNYLTSHNINFTEHNITHEPEYIPYLKEQGFSIAPVVEVTGMDTFAGFRPELLAAI